MNSLDIILLQFFFTGTRRVNSSTDNKDISVSEFQGQLELANNKHHSSAMMNSLDIILLQFFFSGTRRVKSSTDNKDMSVSEFQRQLELANKSITALQ